MAIFPVPMKPTVMRPLGAARSWAPKTDAGTTSGRTILKRLLAKADILIESFPPGHMAGVYQAFTELYYARPFKAAKDPVKTPAGKAAKGR